MPFRAWRHRCTDGRETTQPVREELICSRCGAEGTFNAWLITMHEAMARHQAVFGLKPLGRHHRKALELFADLFEFCDQCDGMGVVDHRGRCASCPRCRGLGRRFTVSTEIVESTRARILAEYPDAGARREDHFSCGAVVLDLVQNEVIDASREEPDGGGHSHPRRP